nr:immunoglobulin light chain junction region [Macaca mulatta]MOX42318.1 immunoglobulin light chain junction region [Macaca mulatta]MOX42503.1 immunoglobulin light chain junction region [Macaca mulatta]MOX42720.1 immunoglobulin light chain junction region [Macaca mulatta]MOX42776.1 immunoglobulin light chain junction region [Macaca mulatta]
DYYCCSYTTRNTWVF